jgi:hypothetical protein
MTNPLFVPHIDTMTAQERDAVSHHLGDRTPLLVLRTGSTLYGSNLGTGDLDLKVIFLPTLDDIATGLTSFAIDGNVGSKSMQMGDVDLMAHSFQKFLSLLGDFDTLSLETLFGSQTEHAILRTPFFDDLQAQRHALIGHGVGSMLGFVRVLLGAMVPDTVHYRAQYTAAISALEGLADTERLADHHNHAKALLSLDSAELVMHATAPANKIIPMSDMPPEAVATLRYPGHTVFIAFRDKLLPTTAPIADLRGTLRKAFTRLERAKNAPKQFLDLPPKDLYHAVRILFQIKEYLQTGFMTFPRPEAETLKQLRRREFDEATLRTLITTLFFETLELEQRLKPTLRQTPGPNTVLSLLYTAHFGQLNT